MRQGRPRLAPAAFFTRSSSSTRERCGRALRNEPRDTLTPTSHGLNWTCHPLHPDLSAGCGGIVHTTDYRLILTGTLPARSGYAGFGQAVALTGGGSLLVGAPASSNDSGAVLTRINLQYVFKQGFE